MIVKNRVWRQILGAPVYLPIAALYGEIGASIVEGRYRKIKSGFGQYMLRTSNELLRTIFGRMSKKCKPRRSMRQLKEYIGEMELRLDRLKNMTRLELKQMHGG